MISDPSQVIVANEDWLYSSLHSLSVHHRQFPEVHCEAGSPKDAAAHLVEVLSVCLDNAPSDWRRQAILQAIEDVRAFAEKADEGKEITTV